MYSDLPKKIWFLWLQGYDDMPEVVQKCYDSWQRYNSHWEIIFLDANSIQEYLSSDNPLWQKRIKPIPRVSISEIVRINLLQKYGGVWVDASCYCCQPLDEWLPEKLAASGFFAFNRPGTDRMIASWFLAALPGNPLVATYAEAVNGFWQKYPDLVFTAQRPWLNKMIRRSGAYRFLKNDPPRWFKYGLQRLGKVYPYFWFHYTFEQLYQQEEHFRRIWDQSSKVSADAPHLLWNHGLDQAVSDGLINDIQQKEIPLYKLSWKVTEAMFKEGNSLHYLLYQSGF